MLSVGVAFDDGFLDDTDDDEPRTIALGARAALMRRPILWEQHILSISDPTVFSAENPTKPGRLGNSRWVHLRVSSSIYILHCILHHNIHNLVTIFPS